MDYEKKYKDALKRAKYYKEGITDRKLENGENILDYIFPELKESEDEKMRAMAIKAVYAPEAQSCIKSWGINPDDVIAWLEKQGEQKPFDYENANIQQKDFAPKVEPKFNEGDWITFYGDEPFKILKVEPELNGILDYLLLSQNGRDSYYNKNYVDTNARHWTIQDAKDGDVLAAHECLVLFREIDGLNIRCYCTYHFMNNPSFYVNTLQNKDAFHPATKEQRDQLEKAMADAGYTFDFEKKELKEIEEQNPAWSEEDSEWYMVVKESILERWKGTDNKDLIEIRDGALEWLESLTDRVWLQPKQGAQKPIISHNALREGITHFGITQYQIDNWLKKYIDVEKQGEQETICDKCRKEQPSHSCQDITELGRCALDNL